MEREEGQQFPSKRAEEHGAAVGSPAAHGGFQMPQAPFPLVGPTPAEGALAHKVMFCFLSPSGGHMG